MQHVYQKGYTLNGYLPTYPSKLGKHTHFDMHFDLLPPHYSTQSLLQISGVEPAQQRNAITNCF